MISVGIDVGTQTHKVVIVKHGLPITYAVENVGLNPRLSLERALNSSLSNANIDNIGEIENIISTGVGATTVWFANDVASSVACDVKGTVSQIPTTQTIIDIGAENGVAIKCDLSGTVHNIVRSDKCAAGVGVFLETMASALGSTIEEMDEMSSKSASEIEISSTCVLFAESEVVSLIHQNVPREDIAHAIYSSIASRIASLIMRIGVKPEIVFIGGVAKSRSLINTINKRIGQEILVPKEPQIIGALGAALLAKEVFPK